MRGRPHPHGRLRVELAPGVWALALLAIGLVTAPAARADLRLYQGSWVAESFGRLTNPSASPLRVPFGKLCNPAQPRCPFASTPVSRVGGDFSALGTACTPISAFGATMRPPKYSSYAVPGLNLPLYRNPFFFTSDGAPKTTSCRGTSTSAPLSGSGIADGTAAGLVALPRAASVPNGTPGPNGMRRTTLGDLNKPYPYAYTYTYAKLRNDAGAFFPGGGPGSFSLLYEPTHEPKARIMVRAGANQFGGVMRLLGKLTSKQCVRRFGGCSLGSNYWRYDAIGAAADTVGGVVTAGYQALASGIYYHTVLMQTSTVRVIGARFPWTTGSVSVTAPSRTPYPTVAKRQGYDDRTPGGKGTIQLVSPVITRWLQPQGNEQTGGIATLRLVFVPEPRMWLLLAAGLSSLAVLYRLRMH